MADYDYYVNCYLGNRIAQKDFSRLAKRAEAYLERMKRVWLVEGGADATAMAICAMAEQLQQAEKQAGFSTATLGGVRVQYQKTSPKQLAQALYRQAAIYLDIYRGKELCKENGVSAV